MGDFISRGIAIGFAAGVAAALVARRHPLTKRHPNLIGFAVAGTTDAITRDYRRPMVYDRLLRLDTPLATRAKSLLLSLRTGSEDSSTEVNFSKSPWSNQSGKDGTVSTEPNTVMNHSVYERQNVDWWNEPGNFEKQEIPPQKEIHDGYQTVKLPKGGPFSGTRTWDDIRKQKSEDSSL
jgi:hypothetical protein